MCDAATAVQAAGVLAQLGTTAYNASQAAGQSTPKMPTPTPMDPNAAIRKQLPQTRANAAANVGSGFSPDFLANLAAGEAGFPGMGLDVLEELRRSTDTRGGSQYV